MFFLIDMPMNLQTLFCLIAFCFFSEANLLGQDVLWYTKPAINFNEALPLGNGRMGAMIYGKFLFHRIIEHEDLIVLYIR